MTGRFAGSPLWSPEALALWAGQVSLSFLAEDASLAVTFRNQNEFSVLQSEVGENAAHLHGDAVDVTVKDAVRQFA